MPRPGRLITGAGFLLAAGILLWGMAALSAWLTREHLSMRAEAMWTALREGKPLWQWPLQRPDDLVARRVFGSTELVTSDAGLRITSRDGTPFELGLPLNGPVDLRHWPLLKLDAQSSASGRLSLSYQATETAAPCQTDATPWDTGANEWVLDLRSMAWRAVSGTACAPPDVVTYMLRLRVQLPAQATLRIRQVTLLTAQPMAPLRPIDAQAADIRLPIDPLTADVRRNTPLVRLPADASAESLLILRDSARQTWPGALILPSGRAVAAPGRGNLPRWVDWTTLSAYLTFLCWLAYRHTPEVQRPWLETAAIAFGPLWLIAGLRWGVEPSIPGALAFVAALIYGGQGEWRRRPVTWSWLGHRTADWLWPLVPLPVAAALIAADGHGLTKLPTLHIVAYFAWALLQQWAMLAVVMGRLRKTQLPAPVIVLITATVFGLLHTPNGALMQLCFMAELWWAWCFLRAPRLAPIAVAHALSALLVESGLTGHWLRSLEVSARFFQ